MKLGQAIPLVAVNFEFKSGYQFVRVRIGYGLHESIPTLKLTVIPVVQYRGIGGPIK